MRVTSTLIAAVALLAAGACAPADNSADPNIATPPTASGPGKSATRPANVRMVTYKIGGTADSATNVTYMVPSGQQQDTKVSLPWTHRFKARKGEFAMLGVTAQNGGTSGTITCEISVDGKVVKAGRSTGGYALVSCDHTLGF